MRWGHRQAGRRQGLESVPTSHARASRLFRGLWEARDVEVYAEKRQGCIYALIRGKVERAVQGSQTERTQELPPRRQDSV